MSEPKPLTIDDVLKFSASLADEARAARYAAERINDVLFGDQPRAEPVNDTPPPPGLVLQLWDSLHGTYHQLNELRRQLNDLQDRVVATKPVPIPAVPIPAALDKIVGEALPARPRPPFGGLVPGGRYA